MSHPKVPIRNMSSQIREAVREAASMAMDYYPNAHLGEYTRREDLRSAFNQIRAKAEDEYRQGRSLLGGVVDAAYDISRDSYMHMDM